ncbi:phosphopantetheine adenylyltransferase [Thalassospira profundimaris]|uniref:Phosphopantetheine adenylyltransferase n=1 Tax=Thalassospira profundimaris TaxID=502049 RepID=A0A367XM65_9PROT|nr:pantetheine-phosphate adenylyltransferase [Thalassospira profundimaris]RCK53812.1 phosphopantetheine adenylyltransferase [Thalassospira profundimaris]
MVKKTIDPDRIGIYPGTFDPVTQGHMDIIRRATRIVDHLIVGVAINAGKGPMFSVEERCELVRESLKASGGDVAARTEVKPFGSLLMHFAEENRSSVIVRGLRAVSDFEYEFQMTGMNARLAPNIETVFLMASDKQQFVSSRFVKEIARLGGSVTEFVPAPVLQALQQKLAQEKE